MKRELLTHDEVVNQFLKLNGISNVNLKQAWLVKIDIDEIVIMIDTTTEDFDLQADLAIDMEEALGIRCMIYDKKDAAYIDYIDEYELIYKRL